MATHLVWLRTDLHIHDNLALTAACRDPQVQVLVLCIATPGQWCGHRLAPRQAAFIVSHLYSLHTALAERGIPLWVEEADDFTASIEQLAHFCQQHQVSHLFYNYQYEFNERQRDAAAENILYDIICQGFDDSVLLSPGSVMIGSGEMYKVFTPFKNAFIRRLRDGLPMCVAAPKPRQVPARQAPPLPELNYPQTSFDGLLFTASEKTALARLHAFCQQPAAEYEGQRDFPAVEGTSRLSPYLATGVLSPRQCLYHLLTGHPAVLDGGAGAIWLNELVWHEFYRYLMVYYPKLCKRRPFITWTDKVAWCEDDAALQVWQRGETGFPIVDTAMRQPSATGWMHNRLRMIVASFLTKDLRLSWRAGKCYSMSQLIDDDLATNNSGWQWAASTGTGAASHFHIFSPTTQDEEFDRQGVFMRRWPSELAKVPEKALHQPWTWADRQGIKLDYPCPIVDHKQARQETLAAWEAARKGITPPPDGGS